MTTAAEHPENLTTDNLPVTQTRLAETLRCIMDDHFAQSRGRVPDIYKAHFASPSSIFRRHWQHRRDIPGDFIAIPRFLASKGKAAWHKGIRPVTVKVSTQVAGKLNMAALWPSSDTALRKYDETDNKPFAEFVSEANIDPVNPLSKLSGKEAELLQVISTELLQLDILNEKLHQALEAAVPQLQECEKLLQQQEIREQQERIVAFLHERLLHFNLPREGVRDMMMFFLIGWLGNSLGQQVAFGSSIATGAAFANGMFLSHQSLMGALWFKWAGVPAWVTVGGALGGLAATMLVAPLISPIAELGVNRLRGERYLQTMIENVHNDALEKSMDGLDMAGVLASYIQLAPDLLVLLRSMRA
ncbi:hypothetical protein OLMES_0543 [Oleiphilus messinensis]|uniref:Uncharacterized protein n=1 Tax=Oleiphilus messinensis TaxID=141451 RepID=A0A1Y0I4D9_9GAMM|nr:hypothetical protein [Oleiphilus messinensis]ARU54646.1 hypothetical protein OLMES_0543 [Oleiphilus messinensis]